MHYFLKGGMLSATGSSDRIEVRDFTLSSNRGYTIVGSFKLYLAEIPQTVAEKVIVAGYVNTD